MKKLFYDVKKCLGCRSCEIVCAVAHSNPSTKAQGSTLSYIEGSKSRGLFAAVKAGELPLPKQKVYFAGGKNYPVSCRHCKDPRCVDACMAAAITFDKKKGVVVHDDARCVGCWMCVMACPYGAVRPDIKARLPVRCDMCPNEKEPACIKGCPTAAIVWQEAEE